MADEIHQLPVDAGNNFQKGFEHQGVDQQVIYGGEVCAQRHVVKISISFRTSERRIDQLSVAARERNVPLRKSRLQCAELILRELISEAPRTAMREKRHAIIAPAEHFRRAPRAIIIRDLDRFAFAKMISAAVGPELANFLFEFRKAS